MENMRQVLRSSVGRSLRTLPEFDRLSAAWPVAAGSAMAQRAVPLSFEGGVLLLEVADSAWLDQLRAMQPVLERELAGIAEVKLGGIHFELKGLRPRRHEPRGPETKPHVAKGQGRRQR